MQTGSIVVGKISTKSDATFFEIGDDFVAVIFEQFGELQNLFGGSLRLDINVELGVLDVVF